MVQLAGDGKRSDGNRIVLCLYGLLQQTGLGQFHFRFAGRNIVVAADAHNHILSVSERHARRVEQ